jgi:TRAP-type C4-dicarboxylate transport system permease small subunit
VSASDPSAPATPRPVAWLLTLGSAALLFAMSVDALAVLGRHLGIPLLGSIEMVQAAILVASSVAVVAATIADKHAVVHLLIQRVGPRTRAILARIHALLCVVFFLALAAGSVWIAYDLRGGYEQSELLGIPYAPLRIVSILSMLAAAAIYLAQLLKRRVRP